MEMQQAIPVLPTTNIKTTILFYKDLLGLNAKDLGGYAVLKKGTIELHFTLCTDKKICESTSCCIKVADIQCIYTAIAAKGLIFPESKLQDLPGGKKGFTMKDNNGLSLHFVQEIIL